MGRLVINLEGILTGTAEDLELRDGDSLNIPKNKQSISVIGEVFVANTHIYNDSFSIDEYINLSGGATAFADNSNIYLVRADGAVVSPQQISSGFFRSRNSQLQAGDTIVVPLQVLTFSSLRATSEISQIIYQMALSAAAVNSF